MMRLLTAAAAVSITLGATQLLPVPFDLRDSLGPALAIAMLVLGLVAGARLRVSQHRAVASLETSPAPLSGAESPSSIAAP